MTFRLDQGFPKLTEPTVDPQTGRLNQTWLQLLISLWNRTGGASGDVVPQIETGPTAGMVADLQNRVAQLETPAPETGQYLDLVKQIGAAALLAPPYMAVTTLQGRTVSGATPVDGYVLAWKAANEAWEPTASSSGSGTVNAGTAGQVAYYATSTNAVSGNANATIASGALTLGVATSVIGQLKLAGNTSGTVTVTPKAAAGTWTLTLPDTAGSNTNVLTTDGAGITSWSAAGTGTVTSVALSLPADFTVSGSPVTTSGTLTAVYASQSANKVLAGPSSGAAATPSYRSLVAADLPAGSGLINVQFLTSGTGAIYTPTAGTNRVLVFVTGPGGGSGGVAATGAGQQASAQGGGGGGTAMKFLTTGFSGSTYTVGTGGTAATAGNNSGNAGGNSTFVYGAGTLTGGAGVGGAGGGAVSVAVNSPGTAGGTASGGDVNMPGGCSVPGTDTPAILSTGTSGNGGTSFWSGGAVGVGPTNTGNNGVGPGAGASGSMNGPSVAARVGAAGANGQIVVFEFA